MVVVFFKNLAVLFKGHLPKCPLVLSGWNLILESAGGLVGMQFCPFLFAYPSWSDNFAVCGHVSDIVIVLFCPKAQITLRF